MKLEGFVRKDVCPRLTGIKVQQHVEKLLIRIRVSVRCGGILDQHQWAQEMIG